LQSDFRVRKFLPQKLEGRGEHYQIADANVGQN
jgi:hypothetical protein